MDAGPLSPLFSRRLSRRALLGGAAAVALARAAGPLTVAAAIPATSIYRGPTNIARVALTFDCGGDAGYTASILDTYARYGIKSSFGMSGQWAEINPGLTQRIAAEGHHLMNHTYYHPSFTGYSTPGTGGQTWEQRRQEIVSADEEIVSLTGASTSPYFRPPYGDYDDATLQLLGELGYQYNVMWTQDLFGWNGATRDQIINRVAANHGNGYIYLMHVGSDSQEGPALPAIIETLAARGYGFATIPGLLAGTGTGGTTTPPPPAAKFAAGDTVKVTAGLYLRTGPGTGYGVITTMPTGTVCTVQEGPTVANGYSWYKLSTPYGTGWAAGEYLEKTSGSTTPPPPPPAAKFVSGDIVKVTAGLYLRTGPGTGTSVIITMPTGTVCTVVSGPQAANGLSWYQLDTSYGRGWAAGEYLEKTTGGTTPTPPPAAKFVAGDTVKVTAGLSLRTGPGTGYGVTTTMPTGTICTVVAGPQAANGLSWYQLDTPYGRGWAAGEYLEKTSGGTTPPPQPPPPDAKFVAGDTVKVTAGLYLRTGPGTGTSVITTMPTGTVCTVVAGPETANGLTWYQLDTAYGTGWAAGEYLEKTSGGTTPPPPPPAARFVAGDTVKVTAGLYLRTGPGFDTNVITTMPTGTVCTIVSGPEAANGLTWYEVDTSYGRGWAAGEYLAKV